MFKETLNRQREEETKNSCGNIYIDHNIKKKTKHMKVNNLNNKRRKIEDIKDYLKKWSMTQNDIYKIQYEASIKTTSIHPLRRLDNIERAATFPRVVERFWKRGRVWPSLVPAFVYHSRHLSRRSTMILSFVYHERSPIWHLTSTLCFNRGWYSIVGVEMRWKEIRVSDVGISFASYSLSDEMTSNDGWRCFFLCFFTAILVASDAFVLQRRFSRQFGSQIGIRGGVPEILGYLTRIP